MESMLKKCKTKKTKTFWHIKIKECVFQCIINACIIFSIHIRKKMGRNLLA
jgi:hypothetical protein